MAWSAFFTWISPIDKANIPVSLCLISRFNNSHAGCQIHYSINFIHKKNVLAIAFTAALLPTFNWENGGWFQNCAETASVGNVYPGTAYDSQKPDTTLLLDPNHWIRKHFLWKPSSLLSFKMKLLSEVTHCFIIIQLFHSVTVNNLMPQKLFWLKISFCLQIWNKRVIFLKSFH